MLRETNKKTSQLTDLREFPDCGSGRGKSGEASWIPQVKEMLLRVQGDREGQSLQVGTTGRKELHRNETEKSANGPPYVFNRAVISPHTGEQ